MRVRGSLLVISLAALALALSGTAQAQFYDDFDGYATGSGIGGQGGWEPWDNDYQWDTIVTDAEALSAPNSLLVAGPADIVHEFTGVDSGTWYAIVQTYVPDGQEGEMFFILLNTYDHGSTTNNWSVQLAMCDDACITPGVVPGYITSLGGTDIPGGGEAELILDQWVEVVVEIDFDGNEYAVFYDGVEFDRQGWTLGGVLALGAFDLYSNGSTVSYMDNVYLDVVIPVELMSFTAE